jgi:hypothetical protein
MVAEHGDRTDRAARGDGLDDSLQAGATSNTTRAAAAPDDRSRTNELSAPAQLKARDNGVPRDLARDGLSRHPRFALSRCEDRL